MKCQKCRIDSRQEALFALKDILWRTIGWYCYRHHPKKYQIDPSVRMLSMQIQRIRGMTYAKNY